MFSGWFESIALGAADGGTACMTIGCQDDFVAVRLGFPNVSDRPWRISRAIARSSDKFNDYVTPAGDGSWTTFTVANAGADSTRIVSDPDAPVEIEVRGLNDSPLTRAARVAWTWTDWAAIRSGQPDPATGMRVLMLRALIPSDQIITTAVGQLRSFTGNAASNQGRDVLIGGVKFNYDMVSNPNNGPLLPYGAWVANQFAPGTIFPIVQLLTQKRGITGIAVGDSHAQGTGTTDQFSGFLHFATALLGQTHGKDLPFGMANRGMGGLQSEEFFARFETLIQAVRPGYAVLPGWAFNDYVPDGSAYRLATNVFYARLLAALELCSVHGIVPVAMTPFPRDAEHMTPARLAPWHWLRDRILALRASGVTVIDATSILGHRENGVFTGTYSQSLSSDGIHPNDAGHYAVGQALAAAIRAWL